MSETFDHDTGEIVQRPVAAPVRVPARYESEQTGQFAEALAKAQGEMDSPKRTKTGTIKGTTKTGRAYEYDYKYAPFEEVTRVTKPLAKHGIAYHQGLVRSGGEYFVRTFLRHSGSGEFIASDYPVITDRSGPQGFGSAVTYAKRYGLSLALGLAAEDDDDGAAAQEETSPAAELDAFAAQPAKKHVGAFSKDQPPPEAPPARTRRREPPTATPAQTAAGAAAAQTEALLPSGEGNNLLDIADRKAEMGERELRDWYETLLNEDRVKLRTYPGGPDALLSKARDIDRQKVLR